MTVENPLGKKIATDAFDVNHRSKGFFLCFCLGLFVPPSELDTSVSQFKVWKSFLYFYLHSLITYLSLCYSNVLSLQFHLWKIVLTVENSFTPQVSFGYWNDLLMLKNLLLC